MVLIDAGLLGAADRRRGLTNADNRSIQALLVLTDTWTGDNMRHFGKPDADEMNLSATYCGETTPLMLMFYLNLKRCINEILYARKVQLEAMKEQKPGRILSYDSNCWMNLVQSYNPRTYLEIPRYCIYSNPANIGWRIDEELDEINRAIAKHAELNAELEAIQKHFELNGFLRDF